MTLNSICPLSHANKGDEVIKFSESYHVQLENNKVHNEVHHTQYCVPKDSSPKERIKIRVNHYNDLLRANGDAQHESNVFANNGILLFCDDFLEEQVIDAIIAVLRKSKYTEGVAGSYILNEEDDESEEIVTKPAAITKEKILV